VARKGSPPFTPIRRGFARKKDAPWSQPDTPLILRSGLENHLSSRKEVFVHIQGAPYVVGMRSPKARQHLQQLEADPEALHIGFPLLSVYPELPQNGLAAVQTEGGCSYPRGLYRGTYPGQGFRSHVTGPSGKKALAPENTDWRSVGLLPVVFR